MSIHHTHAIFSLNIHSNRERSGSVVECLTEGLRETVQNVNTSHTCNIQSKYSQQ